MREPGVLFHTVKKSIMPLYFFGVDAADVRIKTLRPLSQEVCSLTLSNFLPSNYFQIYTVHFAPAHHNDEIKILQQTMKCERHLSCETSTSYSLYPPHTSVLKDIKSVESTCISFYTLSLTLEYKDLEQE